LANKYDDDDDDDADDDDDRPQENPKRNSYDEITSLLGPTLFF